MIPAENPRLIIGAHHDIDPGTLQGALDNSASVVVLLELADRLSARADLRDVEIAFWDMEEPGNGGFATGSGFYAGELASRGVQPELIVVCDVLGLGGPLVSTRNGPASRMLTAALSDSGPDPVVRTTPPSDDVGFARHGLTAALLCSTDPVHGVDAWRHIHSEEDTIDKVDIASLHAMADRLEALVVAMHLERSMVPWREPGVFDEVATPPARRRGKDPGQMGLGL